MPVFLHVGCGAKRQSQTTAAFAGPEWTELRLDIDATAQPDILGSMTDMSTLAEGSVDAIFSSHNIEHLYAHEVPTALGEFLRVLTPDGFLVLTCPDLQSVARLIVEDKLAEPAYISAAGPIAPLDMLYGHRPQLAQGNLFMAHRCGFTAKVLVATLSAAGFTAVATRARDNPFFDLWAIASKGPRSEPQIRELAAAHFPNQAAPVRNPAR